MDVALYKIDQKVNYLADLLVEKKVLEESEVGFMEELRVFPKPPQATF